jgi:hypothetical protein
VTAAPYNRILDSARVRLPGALDGAMQLELFNVLKEFTQRTNIWREEISFSAVAGETEYDLSSSTPSATINRLLGLRSASGAPISAYLETAGVSLATLRVRTAPSAPEDWVAHVALALSDPTDGSGLPRVPDWIAMKYQLGIIDGLLARMMSQPSKPYSSPLADLHMRNFNKTVTLARSEAAHGNVHSGQAWRFPGSVRTRTQRY